MLRVLPLLLILAVPSAAAAEWWVLSAEGSCATQAGLAERLRGALPAARLSAGSRRTAWVDVDALVGEVTIVVAGPQGTLGQRVVVAEGAPCTALTDIAEFVLVTLIEHGATDLEQSELEIAPDQAEGATRLAPPNSPSSTPAARSLDPAVDQDEGQTTPLRRDPATSRASSEPDRSLIVDETVDGTYLGVRVLAGAEFRSGRAPGIGVGPRLSVGLDIGVWTVRLAGVYRPGEADIAVAGRRLAVRSADFTLDLCYAQALHPMFRFGGCAGVDTGVAVGEGVGFDRNLSASAFSFGLGLEVAAEVPVAPFLFRAGVRGTGWIVRGSWTYERQFRTQTAFAQAVASATVFVEAGMFWGSGT